MREFVIGDIHGCDRAFAALLEAIKPERTDTVILLGDYIDRGPDSYAALETTLALNQRCTVVALAGNHEKMLLQSRSEPRMLAEWMLHGGRATLDSYARRGYERNIQCIPSAHWHFLSEQLLDYWETDRHIFVHASVEPDLDLKDQPEYVLFWQFFLDPTRHKSGKSIVCGHTSQKSGLPKVFDKGLCIDTWACGGGWLTCFDTNRDEFIQCNSVGQRRTFSLEMLLAHKNEI